MSIGERLKDTLKVAGISPRNLSAVTKVHFTTIYKLIKKGDAKTYPVVVEVLSDTLSKIEQHIASGALPFRDAISDKEKTDRLARLLATNS